MYNRKLTGKWYLKKKLFGFIVMVEIVLPNMSLEINPEERTYWGKAIESDLIELDIKCA